MNDFNPLRVCHLCGTSVDSWFFRTMVPGLAAHGLLVLGGSLADDRKPAWVGSPGTKHFSLRAPRRADYPRAIFELARLLRRERIEILHTHLFDAGLVGLAAAWLAGTPIMVLGRHHSAAVAMQGWWIHRVLDKWMARRADYVVAASEAVRRFMIEEDKLPSENIQVVQYGCDFPFIDSDECSRVRAEFATGSEFLIGCFSRLDSTKGHVYLVRAFRELASRIPQARLLIFNIGPEEAAIRAQVRENALESRVTFAGHRTDVLACLSAVDVMVLPSLTEAFAQVILEAMAMGTPVVATNVAGAPEVITDGETGSLVPPADSDAIVEAVWKVYANPEQRARVAARGRDHVRTHFDAESMLRNQSEFYLRITGRPERSTARLHLGRS